MKPLFSIDFNWLARDYGSAVERATLAELVISAGYFCVTELEDRKAKTIRRSARLSAYHLAQWFAANWWRLRWEPEKNTISWKMAHKIGAAGGGYLWPDVTFISDGGVVTIHARPTPATESQAVRYLNGLAETIPAEEFEKTVNDFIDGVIGRLDSEVQDEAELKTLWNEIAQERLDPTSTSRRKLEAMMGFDPDDAADTLLEMLEKMKITYGGSAIEEMAAASQENVVNDIDLLWNTIRPNSVQLQIPNYDTVRQRMIADTQSSVLAWKRAETAARIARQVWSIDPGPISNKTFADLLDIPLKIIIDRQLTQKPSIPVGFRDNGNTNTMRVHIDKRPVSSRRFALARLVGGLLTAENEDRLLLATDAATYRQKYQRAFAQEILCPFTDLTEFFGNDAPTDEAIEEAAESFEVSPLTIRTMLVNKGIINREALLIV
jgi:Zn-dependent peptidase ImmA (M78 family)